MNAVIKKRNVVIQNQTRTQEYLLDIIKKKKTRTILCEEKQIALKTCKLSLKRNFVNLVNIDKQEVLERNSGTGF